MWEGERHLALTFTHPAGLHISHPVVSNIMGRSCPTYRTVVKQIIREWQPFRRKLDREGQEAFDSVMVKMQMHSDAGAYAAFCNPVETMFMSAMIEYQKLARKLLMEQIRECFDRCESSGPQEAPREGEGSSTSCG